jgi:hypothetical protein
MKTKITTKRLAVLVSALQNAQQVETARQFGKQWVITILSAAREQS